MTVTNIGRYRVLRELGRGTLATVYLARDPASGQQVAVKVLAENVTAAEDFEVRFQAEMQKLKALDHPALVKLLDFGREAGQYFLVGRYLPGGTLADRLEGRPLLLAEVVPILKRLADALDAAHTAGVVHGNLSPTNVVFDLHERSYLADTGLSHLIAATVGPELSGAPEYMSPEQAQGGAIDGRADVYSLGAMLYEMLTARQPFSADSAFQLLRQHVEQPVPQLSDDALARLVLPAEFNQVLARAMAKDPNARYPTAGVLAEAVRSRFVMPPADPGATVPVAVRAIAMGAPPVTSPPPPRVPGTLPPEGAGPAIVGELVREPEAPAARALTAPVLWGVGIIAVILLLLALARLPAIAGILRSRTATPTGTLFQLDTLTPGPTSIAASATTRASATRAPAVTATVGASVVPVGSATRTATRAPSSTPAPTSTTAPTATEAPTSTNTRAPVFTQTPTQTQTAIPPTETTTSTSTSQPPGPTDTAAPSATVTLTTVPTGTATPTPTITPIPSNTPAQLPN